MSYEKYDGSTETGSKCPIVLTDLIELGWNVLGSIQSDV
jgi:hypothetical protein